MVGPVEIVRGVHGLGSELVNWYLVEEDGRLTAVDAGLPGFAERLEDDLRRIGGEPGDVEAVVLTHSDGDHTGVAPQLQEAGARVLIHSDDRGTLRKPGPKTGDASPLRVLSQLWRPSFLRILGHNVRRGGLRPPKVERAEIFSGGDVLEVPGHPTVLHTPGHAALHFEGKGVLFVGDALCNHELLTGGGGPSLMPRVLNVDNRLALESLTAIERVEAPVLLFGHGDPWHDGAEAAVVRARPPGRAA